MANWKFSLDRLLEPEMKYLPLFDEFHKTYSYYIFKYFEHIRSYNLFVENENKRILTEIEKKKTENAQVEPIFLKEFLEFKFPFFVCFFCEKFNTKAEDGKKKIQLTKS